jgi:hypothetical protein
MADLRQAAQQALEALEKTHTQPGCEQWQAERKASVALRAALAQEEQEPVAYTRDVSRRMHEAGMTFHLGMPHAAVMEQMTRFHDLVCAEASIKAAAAFANPPRRETEREPGVCGRCGGLVYDPVVVQQEQEEPIRPTVQEMQNAAANLKLMEEMFGGSTALEQEEQPTRAQQMRDAGYTRRPTLREMGEQEQEPVAWWIPKAEQFCIKQPGERPFAKAWEPLYTTPPRRKWRGLTEEEIEDMSVTGTDSELRRQQFARAIEAVLRSKNHE